MEFRLLGPLEIRDGSHTLALRRRLGAIPVVGCDGMLPTSRLFQRAGAAAAGTYIAIQGLIRDSLPPAGRAFARDFSAAHGGARVDAYAVYAAQATEVLLAAIARSDGTRAGVRRELMRTRVSNGLIGSFAFDARGDPDPAPISVVRADRPGSDLRVLTYDGARVLAPIAPPWELWGAP
jgi:ABC-type branched-subunit amino acid transport system substrate-binding protein